MTDPWPPEHADWHAALSNDAAAFARIFDLYRDAVFRQALRLMEQPADAEEVASGAFFELWRRRDDVVPVAGSVRPWLLVTAANIARNTHRVRIRREQFLRRLATEPRTPVDAAAFERVDDGVLRADLAAALRRLKPHDVALVTMTALEGYAVAEVAELLGLSHGAARTRLSRAHAQLRGLLPSTAAADTNQEVTR